MTVPEYREKFNVDNPLGPIEMSNNLNYENLRNRWIKLSSLEFYEFNKKEDAELNELLSSTNNVEKIPEFIRAEIIQYSLKIADTIFNRDKKNRESVYQLVLNLLEPGFSDNFEIHSKILSFAPNLKILDAMFEAGVKPDSKVQGGVDEIAKPSIYCANLKLQQRLFQRWLSAGASPDLLVDGEIRTRLLHYGYLEKIYEKGVNLNVIDNYGNTPFFYCSGVDNRIKTLRLLKKEGCDVNHINNEGETALSVVLKEAGQKNKTSLLPGICKDLITVGAEVQCPPNPVPLLLRLPGDGDFYHVYASGRSMDAFESVDGFIDRLLKKKVSLNDKDSQTGNTALHIAASRNGKISRKICEKLIKSGADINVLNNRGQTPLLYAAEHHADKCWKFLLSKKSDTNIRSTNGYSVSEWCIADGAAPPESFLKLILESGAPLDGSEVCCDTSLLGFLIQQGHYHAATQVIDHGGVINNWVIETMIQQSRGNLENSLKAVAKFIQAVGRRGKEALETKHSGAVEKLLLDDPTTAESADPLQKLYQGWPSVFPERQPVVVPNVGSKYLDSILNFNAEEKTVYWEYGDAFEIWKRENKHSKKFKNAAQNNTYDFLSQNHEYIFNMLLLADGIDFKQLWEKSFVPESDQFYSSWKFFSYLSPKPFVGRRVSERELKYVLCKYGTSCLDGLLEIANKKANMICKILMPVSDTRIAPIMAGKLSRNPIMRLAKKWLLRHPEHAIHGLIPIAVGELGIERDQCEAALRFMASQGLTQDIMGASGNYSKNVLAAIKEILSVDSSVDYHLDNQVIIPDEILADSFEMPVISETGNSLPLSTWPALIGMMALSTHDDVYPDLEKLLPLFDDKSLATFSWEVFQRWNQWDPCYRDKDKKLKKESGWMYHCLAYMGNDATVKRLIPYINSWPKSGGMNKSVAGLDIIANIGTDFAIRTINSILLKTKYKPLLERAEEIMETVADVRGLTKDQLDDRLMPSFGLDEPGALTLDFGSRSFFIGINQKLVPSLKDADGKAVKALPKANKSDDKEKVKEATAFWKSLKADLKTEASTQLFRYEQAMLTERRWSSIDFKELLVEHPVLQFMVRRLIWVVEPEPKKAPLTFRVGDNGTFLDSNGKDVTLAADAQIFLPHPLQIEKEIGAWKEVLIKNKLKQPFPQILRQTYRKKNDANKDSFGINGAKAPAKAFRGLKSKGWKADDICSGGAASYFEKTFDGGTVWLGFDGAVTIHDDGIDEDLILEMEVTGKLEDIEYSEVIREIKELLY